MKHRSSAKEYNLAVKITVWADGFTEEVNDHVNYFDPITHLLSIEVKFENMLGSRLKKLSELS